MAELPDLGTHCNFKECKQLDFLPLVCYGCMKTFCKEHHTCKLHSCTEECYQKELPKFTGEKSFSCEVADCSGTELTPVICSHCGKNFCLKHRHQSDHQCMYLNTPKERMVQTKQHVQSILEKSNQPHQSVQKKGTKGRKSKATAAKVALMKMKLKAEGEKGVPNDERIYCKIILPLQCHCEDKSKYVFFSNKWSIGRVVDFVSKIANLENQNNVQNAKKLKLFDTDSGEAFNNGRTVEECIEGELFFSGSSLILEYIDNDSLRLSNVEAYCDT